MPFDFQVAAPLDARDLCVGDDPCGGGNGVRAVHQTNYQAGLSAEQAVARQYQRRGAILRETRWRGRGGEIDLILSEGDAVVFVEVKKSRTHAAAVQRLTARQIGRILRSAEEYLGQCPKGLLTDARLDVALVDAQGRIDIIANASM